MLILQIELKDPKQCVGCPCCFLHTRPGVAYKCHAKDPVSGAYLHNVCERPRWCPLVELNKLKEIP